MDFMLDQRTGLIQPAQFIESPNQDARPAGTDVDLIVVHNISLPPNQFTGSAVIDFFLNRLDPQADPYFATIEHLRVSSHFFIRRDGSVIQFVPLHQRAWHAGMSMFDGRTACNDFSIGIELEGADEVPYTKEQYNQLVYLCITLIRHYTKITLDRIVGHSDIAPGRKTDPGSAFDWQHFRHLLSESRS
jgi:AmpD protein